GREGEEVASRRADRSTPGGRDHVPRENVRRQAGHHQSAPSPSAAERHCFTTRSGSRARPTSARPRWRCRSSVGTRSGSARSRAGCMWSAPPPNSVLSIEQRVLLLGDSLRWQRPGRLLLVGPAGLRRLLSAAGADRGGLWGLLDLAWSRFAFLD